MRTCKESKKRLEENEAYEVIEVETNTNWLGHMLAYDVESFCGTVQKIAAESMPELLHLTSLRQSSAQSTGTLSRDEDAYLGHCEEAYKWQEQSIGDDLLVILCTSRRFATEHDIMIMSARSSVYSRDALSLADFFGPFLKHP